MIMPNFAYVRPKSLNEAIQQLSHDGARIHAGGTDLLGCLRDGVFAAKKVVSLVQLDDLRGIHPVKEGGFRIGALTTLTEVTRNRHIQEHYPALAKAASEVASPQLRNQGTIGGNLCQKPRCWYYRGEFDCLRKGGDRCYAYEGENHSHCILGSGGICYMVHPSDTAPALIAYEAAVRIVGPKGSRRIPLEQFYVRPGDDAQRETVLKPNEVLSEILLSRPARGLRSSYRKVRARQAWDFALAGMALTLQFDGDRIRRARVVFSGAAPIPWRSKEMEGALTGKRLGKDTLAEAADAAVRGAEGLKHNTYKIPLFRGIIEEELSKMAP